MNAVLNLPVRGDTTGNQIKGREYFVSSRHLVLPRTIWEGKDQPLFKVS